MQQIRRLKTDAIQNWDKAKRGHAAHDEGEAYDAKYL